MKKNDINAFGVQGMSKQEMIQTNGGWWGIGVGVFLYLCSEFDSIKRGVQDAVAGKKYCY